MPYHAPCCNALQGGLFLWLECSIWAGVRSALYAELNDVSSCPMAMAPNAIMHYVLAAYHWSDTDFCGSISNVIPHCLNRDLSCFT